VCVCVVVFQNRSCCSRCVQEKRSIMGYNVSCILTMPFLQRKGNGKLLIEFSALVCVCVYVCVCVCVCCPASCLLQGRCDE
jgi:hypothetical protein